MLPPGHAAAGYLVSVGVLLAMDVSLNAPAAQTMLALGFVLGALPDIDMFAAFARTRSSVIENQKKSHRTYITHTPLFWICTGALIWLLTESAIITLIAILAPLSHLVLDSIEDEISWLWPCSKNGYRLLKRKNLDIPRQDFSSYWKKFLGWYWSHRRITAFLEIFLCVVWLVITSRAI